MEPLSFLNHIDVARGVQVATDNELVAGNGL
jgi:hypothetical protein